jgi:tetratricopeptide (TPR) repeat protein
VLSNRFSRLTRFAGALASVGVLMVCATIRPAWAADAAAIDRLNKQALEAFDGLNFDQAKTLLEKAISEGEASGLEHDPSVARAHLDLGMLLIAGFQKRDDAIEQFKAALTIQPGITAPAGLFNPEVQAAFDEAQASVKSEREAAVSALAPRQPARPVAVRRAKPKATESEETEEEEGTVGRGFYLGLGVGSGGGIAKGDLDTNKGLFQNGVPDNSWSGGFATSRLGHLTVDAGYFLSRDLLLSVE